MLGKVPSVPPTHDKCLQEMDGSHQLAAPTTDDERWQPGRCGRIHYHLQPPSSASSPCLHHPTRNVVSCIIISYHRHPQADTAHSFIILLLSGFTGLVRSHFLTAAPYNESYNHYCPKVSRSNPLLYQMTFPCPGSLAVSFSHSLALITHCLFGLLAAP